MTAPWGFDRSPRAVIDLEEIAELIARGNPRRAVTFVDELPKVCRRIAAMPRSFPRREDVAPGLRAAVHGRHLVLFRLPPEEGGAVRGLV